ncbi:MAG: hypothetical protein ACNA7W_15250 [Pseudomonadales bacterium]
MTERPEMGSISASPEDGSGRRRAPAGARRRSGAESTGSSRSIGFSIVLAVLIAGLMVSGWFIVEQHQRLETERNELAAARLRLDALEDRLRTTDEALTETGATTSEQINFWESEIRKLWAVSNDRNRKWIEDNQQAIEGVRKSIGALETSTRDVRGILGRHESAFAAQQQLVDRLTGIEVQLQRVERSHRDLVDGVNAAQQSVASLQSGLANRVKENEQAVAAIDAYRLQLNSRLADLERRLNSLGGAASL